MNLFTLASRLVFGSVHVLIGSFITISSYAYSVAVLLLSCLECLGLLRHLLLLSRRRLGLLSMECEVESDLCGTECESLEDCEG